MKTDNNEYNCCPSHCCKLCGCKYGYDECPVATGQIEQEYMCEGCSLELEGYYPVSLNEKSLEVLRKIVEITGSKFPSEQVSIALDKYLESLKK